jgi:hypothetical protein
LVSVEPETRQFDSLWSDPLVLSALNSSFLIVRLFQDSNAEHITQFSEIYDVPSVPALFYFAPGQEDVAHTWSGRMPSVDELFGFLIAKLDALPHCHRARPRPAKLSILFGDRRAARNFAPDAKLGDVRAWIESECGADVKVEVGQTGQPLPADHLLTVAEAGLTPSALLKISARDLSGEDPEPIDVPLATHVSEGPREADGSQKRRKYSWASIVQYLNPWPDVEETEDFFAIK